MSEATPTAALQDLFNWSIELPEWQRHGLRCLVNESLGDEEFAEALELCRLEHGLPLGKSTAVPARAKEGPPVAVPLSAQDLPRSEEVAAPVTLARIEAVRHVNALADEQTLAFAASGLTVIYGDNASGKSGYARILKRACRARDREAELLPNAYEADPEPDEKPSATIHFLVGESPKVFDWVEGEATVPELPFVQVFDSRSAEVQVTEKNDVVFTPFALDLLQRLGDLCIRAREQLQAERTIEEAKASKEFNRKREQLGTATEAARALKNLNHNSDLVTFRRLGRLAPEEQGRLTELREAISQSPVKVAQQLRTQKDDLTYALQIVEAAATALSAEGLTTLETSRADSVAKADAARLAASTLFEEQPLDGVGSPTWRALWDSARRFSTEVAYPSKTFPVVEDGSRCVLCQQVLSDNAPKRLRDFDEFVRTDTQREADNASKLYRQRAENLEQLSLPRKSRGLASSAEEALSYSVRQFVVRARLMRRAALRACSGRGEFPSEELGNGPTDELRKSAVELGKRVAELERSAQASERRKLEEELKELEDRLALGELLPAVEEEAQRLERIHRIDEAIKSADTKKVSRKSTQMAKSAVTNRLRDQFLQELKGLRVHHARVELAQVGTRQGTPQFQAQLVAKPRMKLLRVLSEGEQTCVALAGFLAELAIAQHRSALVFDDPVSSLDHKWRRHVAARLAEECERRQVIVFTHDAVFLMLLMENAGRLTAPISVIHLERRKNRTGVVVEGAPWEAMRVKERILFLRSRIDEVRPYWEREDGHIYEPLARDIYGLLREAWERGVEELLLNQVVLRFGRKVQTSRLKPLTDIEKSDIATVDAGMAKCSTYMRGHDDAPPINEDVPDLEELEEDVKHFEEWVASMRRRKRS